MSHVAWADAQVMPFPSPQVRQRAKAVLRSFAKYAGVTGRSWVTMSVLLVETDLGCIRTVRRGIADLKEAGFLEETGDHEVYIGKVYPIYQLPLDRGPKNTRDRLRGCVGDVDAEDALGVTPVSPQEGEPEACRDTGVTASGDTGDRLGVTPVSPKERRETSLTFGNEIPTGAREAAARLSEVEKACPRSMLRFYDQPLALAALIVLLGEGVSAEDLVAALGRLGRSEAFRSRKHPPQLHQWLKGRGHIGWMTDDPRPEAEVAKGPLASPPPTAQLDAAPEADQAIWRRLRGRLEGALTEATFTTWFGQAYLAARGGQLFMVAGNATARDWIQRHAQRRVDAWWAEMDPAKRPLTLTTKAQFEAASRREGVE